MFRSATFKLTMWYLAIVMAISLLFSAVLYRVATEELDRSLTHETQRIFTQFPIFEGDPRFRAGPVYANSARHIFLQLAGLNLIVLAGAGYLSYRLARRTLRPIETAHEQQKRFTADVSHELRTPLTALRMESEVALLSNKSDNKELRETLQSNLEEVGKLEQLINNLLRLTRLEADNAQRHFTAVSSHDVATAAVEQVSRSAERRNITIKQEVADSPVQGDRDSLVQLLIILLDNAVKYSHSGQTVDFSGRKVQNRYTLEVKDQGVGIERAAMEHVFDRFYRAESSRNKTTAEGFGLGLSIAKQIADVHGGVITLKSSPGKGTTATLELPLAPAKTD